MMRVEKEVEREKGGERGEESEGGKQEERE